MEAGKFVRSDETTVLGCGLVSKSVSFDEWKAAHACRLGHAGRSLLSALAVRDNLISLFLVTGRDPQLRCSCPLHFHSFTHSLQSFFWLRRFPFFL